MGYLHLYVGFLWIMLTFSFGLTSLSTQCPGECKCEMKSKMFLVFCGTSHAVDTVQHLPVRTTHLLLMIERDISSNTHYQTLNFSHLIDLEVLLMDNNGRGGIGFVHLQTESFAENQQVRILKSAAKLGLDSPGVLKRLPNLEELALSNTNRNWSFVRNLVHESLYDKKKLRLLDLTHFKRVQEPCDIQQLFNASDIFGPLVNSSITHLILAQNNIISLIPNFHKIFRKLQQLNLSYNLLVEGIVKKTHLLQLGLDMMLIETLKEIDCSHQGHFSPLYKPYVEVDLKTYIKRENPVKLSIPEVLKSHPTKQRENNVVCQTILAIPTGNIETLLCDNWSDTTSGFTVDVQNGSDIYQCMDPDNKLKYFSISHNYMLIGKWINLFRIIGLTKLEYLNLQDNQMEALHNEFFEDMVSLQVLLLGMNSLGSHNLFALNLLNNKELRILDLARNNFHEIPNIFHANTQLRQLNFSGNAIENITSLNLSMLNFPQLELLNMSYNKISHLDQYTRMQLDSFGPKLQVDLSNNPLSCGCKYSSFVAWIQKPNLTLTNNQTYTCDHPFLGTIYLNDVNMKDLQSSCSKTRTIVISSVVSAILTMFFALLILLFCKRWHLRYWWHLVQMSWRKRSEITDNNHYLYDAFVAYNWQDGPWVHGPLRQEIEIKRGFKLCIHQRDFIPGNVISDLIVEKIETSRKTLLVLSPNFLESEWCLFELNMAVSRLVEVGRDVLVLVILKPFPSNAGTRTLYRLLKSKVYLEWTEEEEGQEFFWAKLEDVMKRTDRNSDTPI